MWNSPDFNPAAPASDCHSDFKRDSTTCTFEDVEALTPDNPQKIEDTFTAMRCNLNRIIRRWEQIGQGAGGMDNDEEEEEDSSFQNSTADSDSREHIGTLAGRSQRAFLNGRPSYLSDFWEVVDRHQIDAADGSSFGAVSGSSWRRRQRQDDASPPDLDASMRCLSQSILELAKRQGQLIIDQSEHCQHEQQLEIQRDESTKTE